MEELKDVISTLGFPVAMCLLMFWQNTKVISSNTKAFQDLNNMITKIYEHITKEEDK